MRADEASYALKQIFDDLWRFLRDMVADLWKSMKDFARSVLGLPPPDDYSICDSTRAQREWLASTNNTLHVEYNKVKRSIKKQPTERNCSTMRRCMRQVLLLVHPEKFDVLHPKCPPHSSHRLAAEFNAEYTELKSKCGGF